MPICRLAYADFKMAYADTFIGRFAGGGLLCEKGATDRLPIAPFVGWFTDVLYDVHLHVELLCDELQGVEADAVLSCFDSADMLAK